MADPGCRYTALGDANRMAPLASELSPIGLGTFKIGRNYGTKYPSAYDLPDMREVDNLLNGILDMGINYIDTAPAYGLSEERIGLSIAHRRREYLISTKVGETFQGGASTYDFSADAVRGSVQRSLRRLRTDVLDWVFIHSNGDDLAILEQTDVVPTLLALRDEGCIREIGLSGHVEVGFRAALGVCGVSMVTYHQEDRSLEPFLAEAAQRGVPVVVKKGLGSGRLKADEAIPFILGNPAVTSLLIGTLDLNHMRENWKIAQRLRNDRATTELSSHASERRGDETTRRLSGS